MSVLLTIGEFSKMTYLSVKALRHYHEIGILEPAEIDAASSYRRYHADQIGLAQAIRRFRELDMPLDKLRVVLQAPDLRTRNQVILDHLATMQQQLERTQHTVATLQALLSAPTAPRPVTYRTLPATRALSISASIAFTDTEWIDAAFAELHAELEGAGAAVVGPDSALYSDDFFTEGKGEVVVFVPVDGHVAGFDDGPEPGRVRAIDLTATRVAVMVHEGSFADLDRTYGALGTALAEVGLGTDGPIREIYLAEERAEVCWPVQGA